MLRRTAVRLHRHHLRPAARRQRHPVAVHRRGAGRHRAALRRRPLQHRPRLLRDVRPGPRDGRARSARRSTAPRSRTVARSCTPPTTSRSPEAADDEYPLLLTTGRTLYHFHTRTKTGRVPQLQAAAPDVWVEVSPRRCRRARHRRGRLVAVESPRGEVQAPARVSDIRRRRRSSSRSTTATGTATTTTGPRAANELTRTAGTRSRSSPCSRSQPCASASCETAADPGARTEDHRVGAGPRRIDMQLAHYLGAPPPLRDRPRRRVPQVARAHADEHDISRHGEMLAHSATATPSGSSRSPSATARSRRRARAAPRRAVRRPARARSACCATCTIST